MRPMPSAVPVAMPGRAAGSSTRRIVAAFVLPSAYEASRTCRGIACSASRVRAHDQRQRDQRHHRAGGEERAAEHGAALGGERQEAEEPFENRIRPKIASTMLGVPATTSTADSTARASQNGRAYSASHTAVATPGSDRRAPCPSPSAGTCRAAGRGTRPPCSGRAPPAGWLNEQVRAQVLQAAHEHVDRRSRPRSGTAGCRPPSTSPRPMRSTQRPRRWIDGFAAGRASEWRGAGAPSDPRPVLLQRLLRGPARQRQEHRRHEQHRGERVQRLPNGSTDSPSALSTIVAASGRVGSKKKVEAVERVGREARPTPTPSRA